MIVINMHQWLPPDGNNECVLYSLRCSQGCGPAGQIIENLLIKSEKQRHIVFIEILQGIWTRRPKVEIWGIATHILVVLSNLIPTEGQLRVAIVGVAVFIEIYFVGVVFVL